MRFFSSVEALLAETWIIIMTVIKHTHIKLLSYTHHSLSFYCPTLYSSVVLSHMKLTFPLQTFKLRLIRAAVCSSCSPHKELINFQCRTDSWTWDTDETWQRWTLLWMSCVHDTVIRQRRGGDTWMKLGFNKSNKTVQVDVNLTFETIHLLLWHSA